jgi:hypothetical protein
MNFVDYFKVAYELAKKAQSVELQGELMAMREAYNALHEQDLELRGRVRELEEQLAVTGTLTFREPSYYRTQEDGSEDGPFCQRCWDVEHRLVRVKIFETTGGGSAAQCKQCNIEHSRKSS